MFGLTVCIVVDNGHVSQVFVQGRKLSTCYLHTQAVFPSLLHLLRKLSHSFLTLDSYQFVFCKHHFLSKMSEKLCLQWNDFQENIKSAIGNLREDKDLQDVTLVSEDGQQVEAHKVVLASSSPFFQKLKELKILNMRERLLNSMLVQSSKKLLAIEKHPARKLLELTTILQLRFLAAFLEMLINLKRW